MISSLKLNVQLETVNLTHTCKSLKDSSEIVTLFAVETKERRVGKRTAI